MTKVVFLSAVLLVLATALPYAVAFNPIFSTFSSLISDRKNTSLTSSRVNNKFNITVVTWNLAEKTPTRTQCLFLREFLDQDMIVIGVQVRILKPSQDNCRNFKITRSSFHSLK